ncbi:MAG: ATP-binding protein [Parcubacteria group bacterium]|nr:ATP-binding protein [Parcubacteria group bacterium]
MRIIRKIKEPVKQRFFQKKAIIIYGPRQAGKTTLVRELQAEYPGSIYLNCDEPDIRRALEHRTTTELGALIGKADVVFIDEAQRVVNIGLTLKLLVDHFPDKQIVATGSSSFELSNIIAEPLTGRTFEFRLYPFSVEELMQPYQTIELQRLLERQIIYGMYPDVAANPEDAQERLRTLASQYLYKDLYNYEGIRKPELLEKLLQALALQIGNEVSYRELGNLLGTDSKVVERYIRLLESAFVIFRLPPLKRNLRNELGKLRKVYFVDTGIRNAVINNFNALDLRSDTGGLWENFVISERVKFLRNNARQPNMYFWRTHLLKEELDYVEDEHGALQGYEIKWRASKFRMPGQFLAAYKDSSVQLVNRDNYLGFLTAKVL